MDFVPSANYHQRGQEQEHLLSYLHYKLRVYSGFQWTEMPVSSPWLARLWICYSGKTASSGRGRKRLAAGSLRYLPEFRLDRPKILLRSHLVIVEFAFWPLPLYRGRNQNRSSSGEGLRDRLNNDRSLLKDYRPLFYNSILTRMSTLNLCGVLLESLLLKWGV